MKNSEELFWSVLLIVAIILFLLGIQTNYLVYYLVSIMISLVIYKYGQKVILKKYYFDRNKKIADIERIKSQFNK